MRGDIFAPVIDNHLSPAHPCSNSKSTPSPSSRSDRPLCAEERAITNSHSEPAILSRSPPPFSTFPSLLRPPPTPATSFSLFHRSGLSRRTLTLSPSLSLSFSLSHGSSIRTSSTLSLLSFSLSLSFSQPRSSLARRIRPFSLYAHGYLIPREWKKGREE